MQVTVNGAKLFVDIEGPGLVAEGPRMRQKPTLILLHGGPGADHSVYKPAFSALGDLCQIVYYDHLGNGRSDYGKPEDWTLARWGDDVKGLCDALGIDKPIVLGASFGGFVAQAYATRHRGHARALILAATAAKVDFEAIFAAFARVADDSAAELARAYWSAPTAELRQAYAETCLPYYARSEFDSDLVHRMVQNAAVGLHFNGPKSEMGRFDFRAALREVTCPTLVLSGEHDPIMPAVFGAEIAQFLPNARYECLNAAHMLEHDASKAFMGHLRQFIMEVAG